MSAVNTAKWTICLPASGWMMHMKWVLIWELFLLYWKCQSLLPVRLLELYWQSRTHGSFNQSQLSRARTLGWEDLAWKGRKWKGRTGTHRTCTEHENFNASKQALRRTWLPMEMIIIWTLFPSDCLSCWPLSEKDSLKIFSVPPTFILGETGPEGGLLNVKINKKLQPARNSLDKIRLLTFSSIHLLLTGPYCQGHGGAGT